MPGNCVNYRARLQKLRSGIRNARTDQPSPIRAQFARFCVYTKLRPDKCAGPIEYGGGARLKTAAHLCAEGLDPRTGLGRCCLKAVDRSDLFQSLADVVETIQQAMLLVAVDLEREHFAVR